MAAHARLKNEFSKDEKYCNLMILLSNRFETVLFVCWLITFCPGCFVDYLLQCLAMLSIIRVSFTVASKDRLFH